MDHEPAAKTYPQKKRCTCSTQATIKTVYDHEQVIYHCSELCRQHWISSGKPKPTIIHNTERKTEGWLV